MMNERYIDEDTRTYGGTLYVLFIYFVSVCLECVRYVHKAYIGIWAARQVYIFICIYVYVFVCLRVFASVPVKRDRRE